MPPLSQLLQRLELVKKSGSGFSARCPVHDDHSPSLSIKEGDDGRVLVHCHAGCPPQEVVAALGLTMPDLFPANGKPRRPPPAPGVSRTALGAALEIEQQVLFIVAYDRVKGKSISPTDAARERLARQRIELLRRVA
jgi:hypothetical protein